MAQPAHKTDVFPEPDLTFAGGPVSSFSRPMTLTAANADTSASSIAERFAPRIMPPIPEAPPKTAESPPQDDSTAPKGSAMVLAVSAGVPAVILVGLLCFGPMLTPLFEEARDRFSSAQTPTVLAGAAAKNQRAPKSSAIALAAPTTIAAVPGETVAFPIALDTSGAFPPRSILAIRNLPEGTQFSAGRPFGDSEWSLRTDEIAGLAVSFPETLTGASDVSIELVAADGAVMARTATLLDVAPPPTAKVVVRSSESDPFAGDDATVHTAGDISTVAEPSGPSAAAPVPIKKPALAPQTETRVAARPSTSFARPSTVGTPNQRADSTASESRGPFQRLVAAAAGLTSSEEWMETTSWVNMRNGPSSTAGTVKIAPSGEKLRVVGRERNWVHVADPSTNKDGWIYTRYLKASSAP